MPLIFTRLTKQLTEPSTGSNRYRGRLGSLVTSQLEQCFWSHLYNPYSDTITNTIALSNLLKNFALINSKVVVLINPSIWKELSYFAYPKRSATCWGKFEKVFCAFFCYYSKIPVEHDHLRQIIEIVCLFYFKNPVIVPGNGRPWLRLLPHKCFEIFEWAVIWYINYLRHFFVHGTIFGDFVGDLEVSINSFSYLLAFGVPASSIKYKYKFFYL